LRHAVSTAPDARPQTAFVDEEAARRVLLVRACETEPAPAALWSPEDRAWATRLASETVGPAAPPERWLDERARHACERLRGRDKAVAAWLTRRGWRPGVALAVAGAALSCGLLADGLGRDAHVDLLAPPLLGVLAWNVVVYLLLAWRSGRAAPSLPASSALRRAVGRLLQPGIGPLRRFAADWAGRSAPITAARAALLLHVAAAALAAGLVLGLYLRGLVLDFRAGWQSTFLDAGFVHGLLSVLLAPARALTGIALPDVAALAAMRIGPDQVATASAAPWIHLFAVTLALFVIAPRLALALLAALRAWRRARHVELPLAEPYFQRLLADAQRGHARVQVVPHGAPLSASAALGLRTLLAAALGEPLELTLAAPVRYGEEDTLPNPGPGATLRVLCFDLAATPEPEAQGRFVAALRSQPLPLVLLADEAVLRRRFGTMPARLAERRAAWLRFADEQRVGLACVDLDAPDVATAAPAFESALAASSR
jgi:hypothetical protein